MIAHARMRELAERYALIDRWVLCTHDPAMCFNRLAELHLIPPRQTGGRLCTTVGCAGYARPMIWT